MCTITGLIPPSTPFTFFTLIWSVPSYRQQELCLSVYSSDPQCCLTHPLRPHSCYSDTWGERPVSEALPSGPSCRIYHLMSGLPKPGRPDRVIPWHAVTAQLTVDYRRLDIITVIV
eukprot:g8060.t1